MQTPGQAKATVPHRGVRSNHSCGSLKAVFLATVYSRDGHSTLPRHGDPSGKYGQQIRWGRLMERPRGLGRLGLFIL